VSAVVSVEKRVIKRLFVPDSQLVEHEHLLGLRASEDHLLVEHKHIPEDAAVDCTLINLLKRVDVDERALDLAEEIRFVEDHLFSVWNQLSVESEVVHACKIAGEPSEHIERWNEQEA
jgi:hypothetical protein